MVISIESGLLINQNYESMWKPISIDQYVKIHLRKNPNDNEKTLRMRIDKGPNNPDPGKDNWKMVTEITGENGDIVGPLADKYRRMEPMTSLAIPIKTDPVEELERLIIPEAGASHRLDCRGKRILNRDAADLRIISEYRTNSGILPVSEDQVGGFPLIEKGKAWKDNDHDGMPDVWEKKQKLDPNNPKDGAVISSNGYTNLENYLNSGDGDYK